MMEPRRIGSHDYGPLTRFRVLALRDMGCRYFTEAEDQGDLDAQAQALWVCTHTHDEILEAMDSELRDGAIRQWFAGLDDAEIEEAMAWLLKEGERISAAS